MILNKGKIVNSSRIKPNKRKEGTSSISETGSVIRE